MTFFDSLRAYIRRRQVQALNQRASRVTLVKQPQDAPPGSFVYPGIDFVDRIKVSGQDVGYVSYGISPLRDRVYISMLDIEPAHQRQGISLGVLWQLWLTYQVPIVPLHQYASSDGFWTLARKRFAAAEALIEGELRGFDALEHAKQRWQHLAPEPE